VPDVIADERLAEHAAQLGQHLLRGCEELKAETRGRGLIIGIDGDNAELAARVNQMRERGAVIGRTGRDNNVLKIRPPLVFQPEHVEVLERI